LAATRSRACDAGCWLFDVQLSTKEGDVRVTTALCATRRHESSGDERTPPLGCRSSSDEAGGSLIPEARVRAGRKGVTELNQWLNPLRRDAGSNLVDVGRSTAHAARAGCGRGLRSRRSRWRGHEEGLRRTRGDAARGRAGRRPCRSRRGERGNRPGVALPSARFGQKLVLRPYSQVWRITSNSRLIRLMRRLKGPDKIGRSRAAERLLTGRVHVPAEWSVGWRVPQE
jgi:hypothetical protein